MRYFLFIISRWAEMDFIEQVFLVSVQFDEFDLISHNGYLLGCALQTRYGII